MGKCICGHERFGLRLSDHKLIWRADPVRHMLRSPTAWAIQKSILDWHWNAGDAETIEIITDTETYTSSLTNFLAKSVLIDRGYGQQYAMPLASWHTSDNVPTAHTPEVHQPTLFEIAARAE